MSEDKIQFLNQQNKQLRDEVDSLHRELRLGRLRESHWCDYVGWLVNRLHSLTKEEALLTEEMKIVLEKMISDCNNTKNIQLWKELKMRVVENHLDAFQQLVKDFPTLTVNDLRILAFIRLHLSTKEIATITFKPVNTIKAARKRIRKKLGINSKKQSLVTFLSVY